MNLIGGINSGTVFNIDLISARDPHTRNYVMKGVRVLKSSRAVIDA